MAQFNIDSGSNYKFNEELKSANVMRSAKDWSHTHSCTCRQGELFPILSEILNPCTDISLNVNMLTRIVNPPVVPLLSRQRLIVHGYYVTFSQLWTKAHRFFAKGYTSSDYSLSDKIVLPSISVKGSYLSDLSSIFRRLGFNFGVLNTDSTYKLPSLKLMAFLKIWRDYYCNKRIVSSYLQYLCDNSSESDGLASRYRAVMAFIFPSDDCDFRIGSSVYTDKVFLDSLRFACNYSLDDNGDFVCYRDWSPDYFTTAQLKPIFDTAPSVPLSVNTNSGSVTLDLAKTANNLSAVTNFNPLRAYSKATGSINSISTMTGENGTIRSTSNAILASNLSLGVNNVLTSGNFTGVRTDATLVVKDGFSVSGLTIDNLRDCLSATLILEKMAKTDGSYREYMSVMFGLVPKSAEDFRPTYIGGTATQIQFTQVVNTTGSYSSDGSMTSRPQGSMSGLGYGSSRGNIGHQFIDEHSVLMLLASVVPDTYYCQGMKRTDLYTTSEDFYLPERAGLGMQAVMSNELFNTGNDDDNTVYGYKEHWEEWRYKPNTVGGELANPNNKSFFPYVQTRFFKSKPTLTPSFLTYKNNIPSDWLTVPNEVPYICEFGFDFKVVDPVPYRQVEATFGM